MSFEEDIFINNQIKIIFIIWPLVKMVPGGPLVKILPSSAGNMGLIPAKWTKIPHASGKLSLRATATEHMCSGTRAPQLKRSPCAVAKSPHTAMKDLTCCSEDPTCRN